MSDLREQTTERSATASTEPVYHVARDGSAGVPLRRNPKSTASIAGHPIHPMLIPFPIAFFIATFACDLVLWGGGNASWADATVWLLGAGLILSAVVVAILLFTGWMGWEMVYRHRVGVADEVG